MNNQPPPNPNRQARPDNFQVQHRPLPRKGGPAMHPNAVQSPQPGCKTCGTNLHLETGHPHGGPNDGKMQLPTRRQRVSGIGKPPIQPDPVSHVENAMAEQIVNEMEINPNVSSELREAMMVGAPDWAKALWMEVRNTQIELAALKIALLIRRPVITEEDIARARAAVELETDAQVASMLDQLGRHPKRQSLPTTNDPRTAPR